MNLFSGGQFLVHLEEAGDDVGLGGVFGEAVGLQDGGVVGTVGPKKCRPILFRVFHLFYPLCGTEQGLFFCVIAASLLGAFMHDEPLLLKLGKMAVNRRNTLA